jgi:hypothetical protein
MSKPNNSGRLHQIISSIAEIKSFYTLKKFFYFLTEQNIFSI